MRFTPATLRRNLSSSVLNYVWLLIGVTLTASVTASGNAPPGHNFEGSTSTILLDNVPGSYWGPLRLPIVTTGSVAASDPIRFSIQCDKPAIRIGESIDLTITAELLNISPNLLFFLPGSNAYTLKMLLPPGFEQTGGDFTGYVTGELSYPSRSLITYHIRGYFRSVSAGTGFRLLRGQGQQTNDQGLFVEKAVVDLTTQPAGSAANQRNMPAKRSGLAVVTLLVLADTTTDTGAARLSGTTTTASALTMLSPTYNCATGAISFNTSGGDGTTIRYQSIGITAWTTNPNQFLDPGARVDADTPPFTIYVEQSGRTLTYIWSRQETCSTVTPPTTVTVTPPVTTTMAGSALMVLAPTYNCATGAISFNTGGGDGSTIRYRANGITNWTTNPNQFLDAAARVNADTPPFTIYVEQSGRTLTYIWSRQEACSTVTPPTTVTVTPPTTVTVTPPTTVTVTPPVTTPSPSMSGCTSFEPLCSGNSQEVRTVTINVATAGSYSLIVSYRAPEGTVDGILRINDVSQNLRFSQSGTYSPVTTALVSLKAGENSIGLSSGTGGGYFCFNSICLSGPPPPPSCNFTLQVNSINATCSQQALQLTAACSGSDCGGVSYSWRGSGLSYSGQAIYFDAPSSNGTFTYTVTANRSGCPDKTASGTVTVADCGTTVPSGVCSINDYSAETDITYIP